MTVKFEDLNNHDPMYSFVGDDGENTHVASGLLYDWVQRNRANLEVVLTPVDPTRAVSYIRDNVVSKRRCLEMLAWLNTDKNFGFQPMIYGETGTFTRSLPDLYHIDGHHRYVVYAYIGRPFAESYILEQSQWRQYQITGVPDLTKDTLKQMPIKPRDYAP
jgi:hypothetical protein